MLTQPGIVSVDASGQETAFIPRSTTGLSSLTLSVENLDGTSLTGSTYLWTRTTGISSATSTTASSGTVTEASDRGVTTTTVGTTPTISATARSGVPVGEYSVLLTDAAGNTCVAYTTISAKPCTERTAAYTGCKDMTITNPTATNAISNRPVGPLPPEISSMPVTTK